MPNRIIVLNDPVNKIDPLGLMSDTSWKAKQAIMNNNNIPLSEKNRRVKEIPDNLPDPNIQNPYISQPIDLSNFPMNDFIDNVVVPADEMVRSIPPGQGTGYPPADIGLNIYQIIRELQDMLNKNEDDKKSPCK